jgi:hypothetical protein
MNPPEQWVIEEVPELQIIDDNLLRGAQNRLKQIAASPIANALRESTFWTKRRPQNILTGLVECGSCGHQMAAVGKDYLRCARAHRNGFCTSKASIRRGQLEGIVIKALQDNLMAPELVKEFVSAANHELNMNRANASAERDSLGAKLTKVERQIDQLINAIADGLRSDSLQSKLEALETERSTLKAQLLAPAPSSVRLHPNLAEAYRSKVENLRDSLYQEDTKAEAFEILRGLIEKVVIHDRPGQHPEIELIGDIAAMVDITIPGPETQKAARERAALGEEMLRSVKVVAGTGNHRELRCWI